MRGRAIRLSVTRRLVIDLLYFGAATPTIPVQRQMCLAKLVAARAACPDRPRWTGIFVKAYALVAREFPVLRRAYIEIPWPHLYEYAESHACIMVERVFRDEPCVFATVIRDPASRSLTELGKRLHRAWNTPISEIREFRLALMTGYAACHLPRPVRRLWTWLTLNIARVRAQVFGTFLLPVYSAYGAESLHPISPITTALNYGVIADDGTVNVRIIYDHRVMDGAMVARALARLEVILNTVIVEELMQIARRAEERRLPSEEVSGAA
jgi:hypothetical protein